MNSKGRRGQRDADGYVRLPGAPPTASSSGCDRAFIGAGADSPAPL